MFYLLYYTESKD